MDREIDLKAIWETLTTSVDWLLCGIVFLVSLNVLFGFYFAWTVMAQPNFFTKYNVGRSRTFVLQAKQLGTVPKMEEIEVPPPEQSKPLPARYAKLRSTNLFTPLGDRSGAVTTRLVDTRTKRKKKLPKIEGYQIMGRVSGEAIDRVSILNRLSDGNTFVAREGEYLKNTEIKVSKISDTRVLLEQPGHRPTPLRFTTDEIQQRLRQVITLR